MSRAFYYIASAVFILAGAVLALVGDRIGLPVLDLPFWRLLGAAIVVIAIVRIVASFSTAGRSVVVRDTRQPTEPSVLLMKAPRFVSDRRSGQSSRFLVGT